MAFLKISLCALGMSAGSVLDRLLTGVPAPRLCGGFSAIDAGTLASRTQFIASTMPFMLLGGALAAGGLALHWGAKPVRAGLTALVMGTGMVIGHAVTMGMGSLAEWLGSLGGMVIPHCFLFVAARPGAAVGSCKSDTG